MPETTAVSTLNRKSKFAETLSEIGDGSLEDELSELVVGLAARLRELGEHGGKPAGMLTLKLKMKFDRGVFEVDADVSKKEPQVIRPRTLMYPARDGGLTRNNPQQIDAFRDVPTDTRPVRDISVVRQG